MKSSKPNSRAKDKKRDNDLELAAHGLAEAPVTQDRDEGILAAIHALRKDFAQLQEVITSNHGIREALDSFSERLSGAESCINSAEDQLNNLNNVSAMHPLKERCWHSPGQWRPWKTASSD